MEDKNKETSAPTPPCPPLTDDERIALAAREILDKHIAAFAELAK